MRKINMFSRTGGGAGYSGGPAAPFLLSLNPFRRPGSVRALRALSLAGATPAPRRLEGVTGLIGVVGGAVVDSLATRPAPRGAAYGAPAVRRHVGVPRRQGRAGEDGRAGPAPRAPGRAGRDRTARFRTGQRLAPRLAAQRARGHAGMVRRTPRWRAPAPSRTTMSCAGSTSVTLTRSGPAMDPGGPADRRSAPGGRRAARHTAFAPNCSGERLSGPPGPHLSPKREACDYAEANREEQPVQVGVRREQRAGERRVAATPETVQQLTGPGPGGCSGKRCGRRSRVRGRRLRRSRSIDRSGADGRITGCPAARPAA